MLETEPEGALSVADAKASAVEGERIVVRGRIGGRKEPLTEGSPVFTVMDLALEHCGQIPGDSCGTPWDYCCETPESLRTNAATVQLVGEDGSPIGDDLREAGLSELDVVVLIGTVGPRPSPDVLTIKATRVYRTDG